MLYILFSPSTAVPKQMLHEVPGVSLMFLAGGELVFYRRAEFFELNFYYETN